MSSGGKFLPFDSHSSKVPASRVSLGKSSEAYLAGAESPRHRREKIDSTATDVMKVEIMSSNKFVFIVEHRISTYKIEEGQFLKSTHQQNGKEHLKNHLTNWR